MTEIEKLRVLLPHWIEHNRSHMKEFEKWAETLAKCGEQEAADLMEKAISGLLGADKALSLALEKVGGPMEGEGHHRHHHG